MHHVLLGIAEQFRNIDPSSPGTYNGLRRALHRFSPDTGFLFGNSRFCRRTAVRAVGRNLAFFGSIPVFILLRPARSGILCGSGIQWYFLRQGFFRFGLHRLVGSKKRPVWMDASFSKGYMVNLLSSEPVASAAAGMAAAPAETAASAETA